MPACSLAILERNALLIQSREVIQLFRQHSDFADTFANGYNKWLFNWTLEDESPNDASVDSYGVLLDFAHALTIGTNQARPGQQSVQLERHVYRINRWR